MMTQSKNSSIYQYNAIESKDEISIVSAVERMEHWGNVSVLNKIQNYSFL